MSFEKKTFYPTPLSSLNRLTIALETPYGKSLLNHGDTLTISTINFTTIFTALELLVSTGFTKDNSINLIKIVTTTQFSNRVFKIGDNIQIKNFVLNSSRTADTNVDLTAFINREEGHYIINLEEEVNTSTENKGYIKTLYISPPGEVNYEADTNIIASSEASTYDTANLNDATTCKLINKSIQSHYVFKIVTREEDIHSHMLSSNV